MLGNIVGLQGVHTNSLRSPFKYRSYRVSYALIVLLQTASAGGLDPTNTALFNHVMSVAKPLYRCYLTCQNAFPAPDTKKDWLDYVWCEACGRTGVDPSSLALPHVEEVSLTFVVERRFSSREFSVRSWQPQASLRHEDEDCASCQVIVWV